ncbi:MAG: phosphonate C-P lyase system protein PhnH [Albidovulum sp.]|uniref:phosphonate C-P lyase system protein PhnH n=1 Tax=Albidovulum sp. TaxID=1872424 RepID=UPI003C7F0A15
MPEDFLIGSFAHPAENAALAFRACLEAMARPGRVQTISGAIPPAPLSVAAGTVLLTLADTSTSLFLAPSHDTAAIRDWIAFHCGAPIVPAEQATFALGTWEALHPISRFDIGTSDYPDRSATLVVEMEALTEPNARLTGPGIETAHEARLPEIAAFRDNRARFPLGFDCLFTSNTSVTALPRSTHVTAL